MSNTAVNPGQFTLSAGGTNVNTDVAALLYAYGQACFVITVLQQAVAALRAELEQERAQKKHLAESASSE